MKIQKVSLLLLMAGFCLGALAATARAAAPAALVLTLVSGDVVTARVSGDPNSTIQLGFYPPGSTFQRRLQHPGRSTSLRCHQ